VPLYINSAHLTLAQQPSLHLLHSIMPAPYQNTPALSRFLTDSSNDSELDRTLMTPPDKTTSHYARVVSRGHLVPAHSPDGQFVGKCSRRVASEQQSSDSRRAIGTPFSTSNMFEYPFHPEEPSPNGTKPIAIPANAASAQHAGHSSNGSNSPTSPHFTRALREVSREAPIPPSLREKVMAAGA
jgi:hypothetical protein